MAPKNSDKTTKPATPPLATGVRQNESSVRASIRPSTRPSPQPASASSSRPGSSSGRSVASGKSVVEANLENDAVAGLTKLALTSRDGRGQESGRSTNRRPGSQSRSSSQASSSGRSSRRSDSPGAKAGAKALVDLSRGRAEPQPAPHQLTQLDAAHLILDFAGSGSGAQPRGQQVSSSQGPAKVPKSKDPGGAARSRKSRLRKQDQSMELARISGACRVCCGRDEADKCDLSFGRDKGERREPKSACNPCSDSGSTASCTFYDSPDRWFKFKLKPGESEVKVYYDKMNHKTKTAQP